MRRFRFRLQRLLSLRERESDAARLALGQALAAEAAARQSSAAIEQRKVAALADLAAQSGGMGVPELAQRRRHLAALVEAGVQAGGRLAAAVAESERRREALARARQRQRTLERLRERRWAEYSADALRVVQAELDERGGRGSMQLSMRSRAQAEQVAHRQQSGRRMGSNPAGSTPFGAPGGGLCPAERSGGGGSGHHSGRW